MGPKLLAELGRMINLGHFIGVLPYRWDSRKKRVIFTKSRKYWYFFLVQFFLHACFEAFLLQSTITTIRRKDAALQSKVRVFYKLVVFILLDGNPLVTLATYGFLHHLVNAIVEVTESFERLNVSSGNETKIIRNKNNREKNGRGLFTKLLGFVWIFITLGNGLSCLKKPQSPDLLTSLASKPKELPFVVKCLVGLFHAQTTSFGIYPLVLYPAVCSYYVDALLTILQQLRISGSGGKTCVGSNAIRAKYYSQLMVLRKNFNSCFGFWTLSLEMFLVFAVTMNVFRLFIFDDVYCMIVGAGLVSILIKIYKNLGQVYEVSQEVLNSWSGGDGGDEDVVVVNGARFKNLGDGQLAESEPTAKWFTKYRRACQPLSITVGSFFYADRSLVLTLMQIVISLSFNLMVSFRVK